MKEYDKCNTEKEFKHIKEISWYNHNYYVGLKRKGRITNDLVLGISDDDSTTEWYLIGSMNKPKLLGYSDISDEILHRTDNIRS